MEHGHAARFRDWLQTRTRKGVNGRDEECDYVPLSVLTEYWNVQTVRQVLEDCRVEAFADRITTGLLRIFSTLVHLGQVGKIVLFTNMNQDDSNLPFWELPYLWKKSLVDFWEEQWMFCPLEFTQKRIFKRTLNVRHILPVEWGESLRDSAWVGGGPSIKTVHLHPECDAMTEGNNTVVFKVFQGPELESMYTAEASIYKRLSEKLPAAREAITEYYGSFSFEETGTRIIILEYATSGSLLDFFKNTAPPVTPEESKSLWEAMFSLLEGLYALHNLDPEPSEEESINGFTAAIHQDIQPANILVFPDNSKEEVNGRFNIRFKLADFGLAEWSKLLKRNGKIKIKNEGNRMYGAPECYPNHKVQSQLRPAVTPKADVWSLGAVYSEVLAWSIAGELCRNQYCTSRKAAITKLTHIAESGFEACFHDGQKVLDAVEKFHADVLKDMRMSDYVSPAISKFILDEMLRVWESRASTDTLMSRAKEVMVKLELENDANTFRSSWSPPTTGRGPMLPVGEDGPIHNNNQRRSSHARSTTPHTEPPLTTHRPPPPQPAPPRPSPGEAPVEKLYERLGKKKKNKSLSFGRARDLFQIRHSEISIDLPEMEAAWRLIKTQGGRDQIIVIDNFSSMGQYVDQVAKTARVISYVTKVADTDGMDLFLASDPTKAQKHTTSSTVESAIRRMRIVEGRCNMKDCLLKITGEVFKYDKKRIKPTSIYVYTDARWEDANEVANVIKNSIARLVEAKQDPSTLMFQFIQFGNDKKGTKCLKSLDNECKETHGGVKYDIVDRKRWYAKVPSIVIGSISGENDDDDDDDEPVMNGQLLPPEMAA